MRYVLLFILGVGVGMSDIVYTINLDPQKLHIQENNGGYLSISYGEYPKPYPAGKPNLPVVPLNFLLPFGENAVSLSYEIISSEVIATGLPEYVVPEVPPGSPPPENIKPDPSVYDGSQPFPDAPVKLVGTAYMAGYSIAGIELTPVVFYPGTRQLVLINKIRVTIRTRPGEPGIYPLRSYRDSQEKIRAIVRKIVVNPDKEPLSRPPTQIVDYSEFVNAQRESNLDEPTLVNGPYEYLIITDSSFVEPFQAYADWQIYQGRPAIVVTTQWIRNHYSGVDDAERIRNFIKDAYRFWGISWVLLGGDSQYVPARYFYQEIYDGGPDDAHPAADFYFSNLDGNWNKDGDMNFGEVEDYPDPLPEVFHGRVPVSNVDEAWNFVNKSISYITEPGGDSTGLNAEYVNRVLALGTDLWGANEGSFYAELVVSRFPKYLQIYRMYEDSTHNNTLQEFVDYLNWGMGLVYINAHATYNFFAVNFTPLVAFGIPEVGLLNNKGVLPFIFITACNASGWDYISVMEEFIKAQNTGAIGVLGVTRLDYPSSELAYTFLHFDTLFSGVNRSMGDMIYAVTEYWALTYQNSTYRYLYLSKVLLGDPSINLWKKPPRFFDLDYPVTVHPGLNTYTFTVTDRDTREPVSGAKVVIYKEGEVYEQGRTDRHGQVTLSFMPQTQGKIYFSVVRDGYVPKRFSVNIQPGGMYARIQSITFNDSTGYGGYGDGDGIPEAGETVLLRVTVENTGSTPLFNIFVRMNSLNSDIIVTSDSGRITGLAPGASVVLSNNFSFHVIPDAEQSYHKLVFSFSGPPAFSTTDPLMPPALWSDTADFWVQNARVAFTRIYRKIKGDTLLLWPEIVNLGEDIANSINIFVTNLQGVYEAIDTTYDVITQLMPGEVYFDTTDSPIILTGNTSSLQSIAETWYLYEDNGYQTSIRHINKYISPPADLSVTPMQGGLILTWNSIGEKSRYVVFKRENQQLVRLVKEPIQHSIFTDAPLPPGSKGVYWVIGIDSLYNSTLLSDSAIGYASPELKPGWPQPYTSSGVEESHHPIAVDFDPTYAGKEIIFGTTLGQIYAFHNDGTYVPGWPVAVDGEVWGAIAAGDIDNDGVNEIVVVPRNGNQHPNRVYAFEYDGSYVSGWPKDFQGGGGGGNSGSYANPTIVDLDGDGTLEVLVHGMKGKIYCWNGDGSSYIPGANGYFASGGHGGWNSSNLAIGDIDGDGENEVVVGTRTADSSIIAYDALGNIKPGFPVALGNAVISGIAIGDISPSYNGLEIVCVTKNRKLYAISSNGNVLPGWPKPVTVSGGAIYALPSISDVNNDGVPDILVNENTRISVYNATGALLDTLPFYQGMTQDFSQVTTADIDNDGVLEVFTNHTFGKIYGWENGQTIPGFPINIPEQIKSTPVIDDIDGDGYPELIVLSITQLYVFQLTTQWDSSASAWHMIAHDVGHTSNFNASYSLINPQIMGWSGSLIHDFMARPHPNPASNGITIEFGLSSTGKTSLSIYNSTGRRVALLVNRVLTRGFHSVTWNTRGVPSGVYFLRLETPKLRKSQRVVVTH